MNLAQLKPLLQSIEGLREVIARAYPDATRSDNPYYEIRSHMASVLRNSEDLRRALGSYDAPGPRFVKDPAEPKGTFNPQTGEVTERYSRTGDPEPFGEVK